LGQPWAAIHQQFPEAVQSMSAIVKSHIRLRCSTLPWQSNTREPKEAVSAGGGS
jgi:hypothetical protein